MPPRLRTLPRFSPSVTITTSTATATATFPKTNLSLSNRHACASAASFSTTAACFYAAGREPTYYEILNVPVTASTAEIKKQFYALSLLHHPDRNRSDPNASSRFATISSAYEVLSDSAKRAKYDRDNGILNQNTSSTRSSANPGQHPMGSSYGANVRNNGSYVGSRPASGLSKRRGPFRGPPPSFYAHGGYGARGARPGGQTASASASASAASAGATTGPSKTEEDPTSFIKHNPVWHFNAQSHFRTQSAEDARRRQRKSRELGLEDRDVVADSGGLVLRFVVVCGILVGAGTIAGVFQSRNESNTAARSRASSSR
ncbi:hypothetical protein VTN77DRAFT_1163 [Rasamsonia byssochlamydoides]|uniref:uncharacterized protein n=1 Tax=Rasamsonia byssochlamydoides TaxID=89139 RepID=UPI00374273B1